ncbi:DUF6531 domain-containing protein [Amycolatopsis tucumanensis]|uniref:DUF6531 domain-containing protein n=1 Tax=Amycolatopsis tucumanensis TaxID=401106 RepID=UPI003D73FD80
MSNPLVAQAQSQTTAVTGIGILESAQDLSNGIKDGSWVEGGLGALGTGLEVLSMVIDPLGTLAQYGVAWLIEHVRPLKEALDWLAGDPPVIQSFSDTWANVAREVGAVAGDLKNEVDGGTAGWTGQGADTYRENGAAQAEALAGAASLAEGISSGVMIMGTVVGFVREMVRDIVAELVGKLITWALEAACTLGFATPLIAAQATAAISSAVTRIADFIRKLVKTIGNVSPRISRVIGKLDEIIQQLSKLGRKLGGEGTTPSAAHGGGGKVDTPDLDGPTSPDAPNSPDGVDGTPGNGQAGGDGPSRARDSAEDPRKSGQDEDSTCTNGDPINVFTGEVILPQVDVDLPAVLPLTVRRRHASAYRLGRWFGRTWASTFDQRLEVEDDGIYFVTEDGRVLVYPHPVRDGQPVFPVEGARWPLVRTGDEYVVTHRQKRERYTFGPVDGAPDGELPLRSVVGRTGQRLDVDYENGAPSELRHSGNYRVAVTAAGGRITALTLRGADGAPDVPLLRYGYDDEGRLTEVFNSSNRPLTFAYDRSGRITRWVDRNGEWYGFHYDGLGRCVRTEGSGGAHTGTLRIDQDALVSVWTDAAGHETTYRFNELRQIVEEVDALGGSTRSEWDRYDRLLSRTDPLGRTTSYRYDDAGNLVTLTRPDGTQRLFSYDRDDQLVATVEPTGAVTRRDYDEAGNLVAVTDPAGAVTRYRYDERNHLAAIVDPLGGVHQVETNDAGLPIAMTGPDGAVNLFGRDQFGRIRSRTDPAGATTTYTWTVEGLLLSRTGPDGTVERWQYDGEGNQTAGAGAAGELTHVVSTHFDLPAAVTTPDGNRLEYTYDEKMRPVVVRNAAGSEWRYVYDAVGNLVRETDFTGRTLAYTYDAAGQVVSRTNGAGETTRFTYDLVGNLVERQTGDAPPARFTYDAAGRLVRAVNADADVRFERDEAGRVVAETVNGRTVESRYDLLGRPVYQRTPTGVESRWSYDAGGRPSVLSAAGRTMSFRYDSAGREVERLLDTGISLAQEWDAGNRLLAQTLSAVSAASPVRRIQHRTYRYRADDQLVATADQLGGLREFDLDQAGRVVGVRGAGWAERYDYDRVGNLRAAHNPADPEASGPREVSGTLTVAAGNVRYAYDRQGRMVLRQRKRLSAKPDNWHFAWDGEDRLVGLVTPDGTRWRYAYDALGRRISKQRIAADGHTVAERTDFVWDDTVLVEQIESGGRTKAWHWLPDTLQPVSQTERLWNTRDQAWVDREFYGIVTDLIGTPTELVDAAGNLAWRATRSVWGLVAGVGAADTPLRFPGQYHDPESGLDYNYHRYYVPELGRYASQDPLGLVAGPNPQAYVPNPMTWLDPLGLVPCRDCDAQKEELPKGDNRWFDQRREAFNAARDRAGIPNSASPARQWTVGDNPALQGRGNYHYDSAPGAHGRYYEYETPNGPRVIAEHTNDPRAPHPHFHAYQPKAGHDGVVIGEKYDRVDGPHHYYYGSHAPSWPAGD